MLEKVTVGLLQRKCLADSGDNLARTIDAIRDAAARGAQIICTEELFRSPYFCREENHDRFDLAEPIPGPTTAGATAPFQNATVNHDLAIVVEEVEAILQLVDVVLQTDDLGVHVGLL